MSHPVEGLFLAPRYAYGAFSGTIKFVRPSHPKISGAGRRTQPRTAVPHNFGRFKRFGTAQTPLVTCFTAKIRGLPYPQRSGFLLFGSMTNRRQRRIPSKVSPLRGLVMFPCHPALPRWANSSPRLRRWSNGVPSLSHTHQSSSCRSKHA